MAKSTTSPKHDSLMGLPRREEPAVGARGILERMAKLEQFLAAVLSILKILNGGLRGGEPVAGEMREVSGEKTLAGIMDGCEQLADAVDQELGTLKDAVG